MTMHSDLMNKWLKSKKPALLNNLRLCLKESPFVPKTPLCIQCGQAEVFFLKADDNKTYILKRFHGNNCPDSTYIEAIASLLPPYKPFQCGTQRQVLRKSSLKHAVGCFYSPELAAYLEKTILMPKTAGQDWNSLNEQQRNRKVTVSRNGRLALCNNLAQIIKSMEKHQVSHRDLSAGNVFLDKATLEVALIDFDSLYHPGWSCQAQQKLVPKVTLHPLSDRRVPNKPSARSPTGLPWPSCVSSFSSWVQTPHFHMMEASFSKKTSLTVPARRFGMRKRSSSGSFRKL
jgi:serine/threonine protein kinase